MNTTVEVAGRALTFPIEVREASSWAAQFVVPTNAARAIIAPTELEPAEHIPGRTMATIVFVHYEDSDLDTYDEVGIAFVVRAHDAPPVNPLTKTLEFARQQLCVYIHHLPVNQAFTLEAGRALWGYPKFMADIRIDEHPGRTTCSLRADDQMILGLTVRDAGPIPLPARTFPTYTFLAGTLRKAAWEMPNTHVRARIGGARLVLGTHPIADELRGLGLPKRALMTQVIPRMRARFGPAEVIEA